MTTLLLTKEDVRGLIDMPSVIRAVEEAYRTFSGGEVDQAALHGHPPLDTRRRDRLQGGLQPGE